MKIHIYRVRVINKGEKFGKVEGSEAEYSYKLDPSKRPKQIDITHLAGPAKGKTQKGLYALKDDHLRLDVFFVPPGKERPTDFSRMGTFFLERVKVPDPVKK